MKKFCSMVLVTAMLFAIASCDTKDTTDTSDEAAEAIAGASNEELSELDYLQLHEDDISADTEWSTAIWTQVLEGMVNAGEATSTGDLNFILTDAGIERYSTNDIVLDDKIIIAGNYGYGGDTLRTYTRSVHDDQSLPYYYYAQVAEASPEASFASTRDECRYLIIILGVPSVESGFYEGGIDRTSISTEVVIIDVEDMSIVHIEHIGTDTPEAVTQRTSGLLMEFDAMEYIASIT